MTRNADDHHRASTDRYPLQQLTGRITASAYGVQRKFGYGYLESVYRRALAVEMQYHGIAVAQEVTYELFHRGVPVGLFRADLVADSRVIVEAKTGLLPDPVAPAQLLNYLRAADLSLGLLIHFGPRGASIKRVVASPEYRARWQRMTDAPP
jgi:GxxExxY protein